MRGEKFRIFHHRKIDWYFWSLRGAFHFASEKPMTSVLITDFMISEEIKNLSSFLLLLQLHTLRLELPTLTKLFLNMRHLWQRCELLTPIQRRKVRGKYSKKLSFVCMEKWTKNMFSLQHDAIDPSQINPHQFFAIAIGILYFSFIPSFYVRCLLYIWWPPIHFKQKFLYILSGSLTSASRAKRDASCWFHDDDPNVSRLPQRHVAWKTKTPMI